MDHLAYDGVMGVNVGRSPADRALVDQIASTIETVFPSVFIVDVPGSFNCMIYATKQTTRFTNCSGQFGSSHGKCRYSQIAFRLDQVALDYLLATSRDCSVYR